MLDSVGKVPSFLCMRTNGHEKCSLTTLGSSDSTGNTLPGNQCRSVIHLVLKEEFLKSFVLQQLSQTLDGYLM